MNKIKMPDRQEGVRNENIINKQEVTVDTMKKNKIKAIFYSLVGGALIAIGLLFLLALTITGTKNTMGLIITAISLVFAAFFLWIAYKL